MSDISDSPGKTMRIDIHPDFRGETLARKRASGIPERSDATTAIRTGANALELSREFEMLLQSIYDAVFITDDEGRIIRFNMRAVDFFLASPSDFFGARVIDMISGADDRLLDAIRKNLKEHRYTLVEAHCVRKDKSLFPAEVAVNQLPLDGGISLCFFVRDVTVRKRAQEALEQAVTRLEEHDRARSQFVSNVSHELRTPLTSMIYAVNNMLKGVVGALPDGVRRYLEMMDGDCKRLLGTVNDILDMRKIETKTLTLQKVNIPVGRLVKRTMDSMRVQAEQKGINVSYNTGEGPWFAECDVNKVERVVLNLVSNAIKFTPEGGSITVDISSDPAKSDNVMVSILDTGMGIPPEAVNKVTQRYFTVGEQASGSGLGLAISREIIELHGGKLWLASPPKGQTVGTGVYFSIPSARPPTILIADDDPLVLQVLQQQVAEQGYCVITAGDGQQALDKIMSTHPHLVILDFIMPVMEGTEVILKMKGSKTTMRIPILVITGAEIGRGRAQILNSFSIPALSKPWQEQELLDRIEGAFLGAGVLTR